MVVAAIQKNILEHISIMAQEQVQLEFSQELQQLPILQQQSAQNPAIAQQLQMITQRIESRKAVLVAEMTSDFMKEENKITSQFDSDPLLKLKSREVDLRAMENEQKRKEAEDRINLQHNPTNPNWANRDRFILSNGHGSMLIYSLLHLAGYDLPMDEIKTFRQLHSKCVAIS